MSRTSSWTCHAERLSDDLAVPEHPLELGECPVEFVQLVE
jgi:hypothetical protein